MLHLIFQSPLLPSTLQRIGNGDAVLFLENSVMQLLKQGANNSVLNAMLATNRLFVLLSDIETRGISADELVPGIAVIDYSGWVTLTTQYQRIQSWS